MTCRKLWWVAVVLLVLLGAFAAWAAPPAGRAEPIKIGAIFSVTGGMSSLGEPEEKTAKMLEAVINRQGGVLGRPIRVICKDDGSQNDAAVLAAKDLLNNQKVCAIIGPSGTPTTMAIKDVVQEANCPLVSCAAGAPITQPVAKSFWTFRTPQMDICAVQKIIDYCKKAKITKVASIYVTTAFGKSGNDQIQKLMPQAGIQIVATESFGAEDTDMTAQLTRIKAKGPQAVICWAVQAPPAAVAKNIRDLKMDVKVIMSHGVANRKFIELAGPAAEGVMFPAGWLIVRGEMAASNPRKAVLEKYAADYQAKYHKAPDTFGGHAHDAVMLVVAAIKKAGSADRGKIRDALAGMRGFQGIGGVFNYSAQDHDGLTKDAFAWVTIKGGQWKLAK